MPEQRPNQGDKVILRDPGSLLSSPAKAEQGDVVCWNYSSADTDVDATGADLFSTSGLLSNVEVCPAALASEVESVVRFGVVASNRSTGDALIRQTADPALNDGAVGREIVVASSGLVIAKVQIPSGDTFIRPGAGLVYVPGQRYLTVVDGTTDRRIVARLTYQVGPNAPDGTAYAGTEVVFALVERHGETGLGYDTAT